MNNEPNTRGLILLLLCNMLLLGVACQESNNGQPEVTRTTETDFADTAEVSATVAEGFTLSLWAPGPLLHNAVAISMDYQGHAYVSETERRKSSDIDIRAHRDWVTEDMGLQSLEDTEAFHKAKLDPQLSDQNTWQEDFNEDGSHDWRDLMVQSERVRRVWDSDGDGRADASNVFADGFNDMLTGVAAGVLHQNGQVFLTAAPDVWRLKDRDGDGDADERESISHGYGIHIAYAGHDMSGLTMGPDGKIYWSIGDMGLNVVDKTGKRWAYPNEGAVMRANPDGSNFEVFARGLRNPQELAFDAYGNLISVDNDGDHPGEHERFVHIVEGSDSGWRINWQFGKYDQEQEEYKVWMDEKLYLPHFEGQAAYLLPPLAQAPDGPAGLAYNPGTAFSSEWNNHFFGSYFTGSSARSQIEAFRLEPKGSSFEVVDQQKLVGGIVPTGVTFGPGGALYALDWKDGYDKKPEGRIWKLDVAETDQANLREETRSLLEAGMADRSEEALGQLLGHADMRVRMEAQFELVKRGQSEVLAQAATQSNDLLARLHGIWGLGQLLEQGQETADPLLTLLNDSEPEVRAQSAKVLGQARQAAAFSPLLNALQDSSPRVKFYAAEALGKLGNADAFEGLVTLLEETEDQDPHLRHAATYALAQLGAEDALASLETHANVHVRLGAVVALRRMESPVAASFLADEHPWVVTEAARAIHDDLSIPEAMPALAEALITSEVRTEAFLRRAINANLRLGNAQSARRLLAYAQEAPEDQVEMRADALWALGYWKNPPVLDRVDNRHRGTEHPHELQDALAVVEPALNRLFSYRAPAMREGAVSLVGRLGLNAAQDRVFRMAVNAQEPPTVRAAALRALSQLDSDQMLEAMEVALSDRSIELRQEAQSLLSTLELADEQRVAMIETLLAHGSLPEQQQALAGLAQAGGDAARGLLNQWVERLMNGSVAPGLQLDVIQAVENSEFAEPKEKLAAYEAAKSDDPMEQYAESLYGGNVRRGQRIFYRNTTAQCIRCHVIEELGGAVGPNLTQIASVLGRKQLLESVVAPSNRLAPGYGTAVVALKDGSQVVGTIQGETSATLTLQTAQGETRELAVSEIANRENAPSAMPSMAGVLSKGEIRDVVAYLSTLK